MRTLWLAIFALLPVTASAQIHVESATYGQNCGAPQNNAKGPVAARCNNRRTCVYTIDYHVIGDPVPGCAKNFVATWTCGSSNPLRTTEVAPEAGFKKVLRMGCASGSGFGSVVAPPRLEITAINPQQPILKQPWGFHFKLTNDWLLRTPLTGWLEARTFDARDAAKATPIIVSQSYPIADLQPDQAWEGDIRFPTMAAIGNGVVELTYFHITSGYTPGPRSADGVLQYVPPDVKAQLLSQGNARALSAATGDFKVAEAERFATVFDFDTDSCFPSPAVFEDGIPNSGLDEASNGITSGCRHPEQLQSARTYYRSARIEQGGVEFSVHMYALYFMKDKTVETALDAGHRHDWEFALVWATNGVVTHGSRSAHGKVRTEAVADLDRDAEGNVKIVYHKDGGITHAMRFADRNEVAENPVGRFFTPMLMKWETMSTSALSNVSLRHLFNTHSFGEADCSFNDNNFPNEIAKWPPPGYPSGEDWRAAGKQRF